METENKNTNEQKDVLITPTKSICVVVMKPGADPIHDMQFQQDLFETYCRVNEYNCIKYFYILKGPDKDSVNKLKNYVKKQPTQLNLIFEELSDAAYDVADIMPTEMDGLIHFIYQRTMWPAKRS